MRLSVILVVWRWDGNGDGEEIGLFQIVRES